MALQTYYVLKVKGKAKIPDYLQVRDSDFTLIGYFRPGRGQAKAGHDATHEALFTLIEQQADQLPFGQVVPLHLDLPTPTP